MYSPLASEHFHQPRRVGPLEGATHTGTAGAPGDGPYVALWLRVEGETIVQAAYRTFGCPAAIASSSVMAELLEGKSLEAAHAMTLDDLNAAIGELPEGKDHCPRLAYRASRAALSGEGSRPVRAAEREGLDA